ncbi:hypothetical protein FNF31_07558 [Cafeteria roenbergensis]|uniref:Uncharacterized protein n=1 Tax=Cafeteria roenbergensis TaxID=33653 RepID=A0A5A8C3Q7_CAFRO|nr:hypothetical protein FNF31_07558 [Cafeteria roenbergensis]
MAARRVPVTLTTGITCPGDGETAVAGTGRGTLVVLATLDLSLLREVAVAGVGMGAGIAQTSDSCDRNRNRNRRQDRSASKESMSRHGRSTPDPATPRGLWMSVAGTDAVSDAARALLKAGEAVAPPAVTSVGVAEGGRVILVGDALGRIRILTDPQRTREELTGRLQEGSHALL